MQTVAITVHLMHHSPPRMGWYGAALIRELTRTFLLAVACSSLVGAITAWWRQDVQAAMVIAGGIFGSLLFACFPGGGISAFLHRMRLDIRVASGPLTPAFTDIRTFAIYFSLAAVMLGQ